MPKTSKIKARKARSMRRAMTLQQDVVKQSIEEENDIINENINEIPGGTTNNFRRIKFLFSSRISAIHYISVLPSNNPELLFKQMKEFCKLEDVAGSPKLILSILGCSGHFEFITEQKEHFKDTIKSIALHTNTWIITNGLDRNISKICGEAVAELRTQNHDITCLLIGIVQHSLIVDNNLLAHDSESEFDCLTISSTLGLDINHDCFVIVGNGCSGRDQDCVMDMRVQITKCIVQDFEECKAILLMTAGSCDEPGVAAVKHMKAHKSFRVSVFSDAGAFAESLKYFFDMKKFPHCGHNPKFNKTIKLLSTYKDRFIFGNLSDKSYNGLFFYKLISGKSCNKIEIIEIFKKILCFNQLDAAGKLIADFPNPKVQGRVLFESIIAKKANFVEYFLEIGIEIETLKEKDIQAIENLKKLISKVTNHCGITKLLNMLKERKEQFDSPELKNYYELNELYSVVLTFFVVHKEKDALFAFIKHIRYPITYSIFICKIYQLIYKKSADEDSIYTVFQDFAIETIDTSWKENKDKTIKLLFEKNAFGMNLFSMAFEANTMKLLSTKAFQHLFKSIWNGEFTLCGDEKRDCHSNWRCSEQQILFSLSSTFSIIFIIAFASFICNWNFDGLEKLLLGINFIFAAEDILNFVFAFKMLSYFWFIIDVMGVLTFFVGIGFSLRLFYIISFNCFLIEMLQISYLFETLGPKLEMMKEMLKNAGYFLYFMTFFIFAFGVTDYVISNTLLLKRNLITPETTAPNNIEMTIWFLNTFILFPYFKLTQKFTEKDLKLSLNGLENIRNIILIVYKVLTIVLLLKILNNLFSEASKNVQKLANIYFNYHRFQIVLSYGKSLPRPFTIFSYAYMFFLALKGKKEIHVEENSDFGSFIVKKYRLGYSK